MLNVHVPKHDQTDESFCTEGYYIVAIVLLAQVEVIFYINSYHCQGSFLDNEFTILSGIVCCLKPRSRIYTFVHVYLN